MNIKKSSRTRASERGAATLLTALVLLIGVTATLFYTGKTVLMQIQNTANEQRAAQALAAANAAMDYALAYFDQGGPAQNDDDPYTDDDGDGNAIELDYTQAAPFPQGGDTPISLNGATGSFYFDLNDGKCAPFVGTVKTALIVATGQSDDNLGQRTIRQCVSALDIFGGNAPRQPLVARGGVGLTGNYKIINRFNNTTIWSGNKATIGMSASASTYLREQTQAVSDLTKAELENIATNNSYTSQPITDRNKGSGVDTIDEDPRLSTLTPEQFFNNFFFSDRDEVKSFAQFTSMSDAAAATTAALADSSQNASGIVWVDGDATINGGQYGLPDQPQIIIINGNFESSGNPVIYGMLYIAGQFDAAGTPTVYGSVVVEGDPALVPTGESSAVGNGTVNLVYTPFTLDRAPNPFSGTTAPVTGSWRDW